MAAVQQVVGSTLGMSNGSPSAALRRFTQSLRTNRGTALQKDHSQPITPLAGPVTDICEPLNCQYHSREVPRLTRQRICPMSEAFVAVSSVTHT